ncbi:MAG: amino acid adenylation domain-containing protein, partial [bacterium]|nr:amino acid adenylation domain-containing protein [bacterium]
QVNVVYYVPRQLEDLLAKGKRLKSIRVVLSGGERLFESVKTNIIGKGYALYNLYGPTETSIDVLAGKCTDASVTLGKPIANAKCFILDRYGNLVPNGTAGELYIGGVGVARGYLNRPELTAEKFVLTAFHHSSLITHHSEPLYMSGDRVRRLHDGNIQFLGRIDLQVKIRGFRI